MSRPDDYVEESRALRDFLYRQAGYYRKLAPALKDDIKDAADALGLAISHAHAGASFAALAAASPLQRRQHAQYRKGRTY